MRVLIVGGGGMLGHRVWMACRNRFDAWTTLRDSARRYPEGLFDHNRTVDGVDVRNSDAIARAIDCARPDAIVNCVGIVKQRAEAADPIAVTINALFPHQLAAAADAAGARLIHISTDCVFSGGRGNYDETDVPDAEDLYGRSKLLGEVAAPHLTLRTSLIGRELKGCGGLVEWFLSRRGRLVRGYKGAIFSGVTTTQMARILVSLLESDRRLEGLYHVAADPISKHDLLTLVNAAFDAGATIEPDDEPRIDRSLNGARFRAATGLCAPPWPQMVAEMAADPAPYDQWRQTA